MSANIPFIQSEYLKIDTQQMIEVDRLMIKEYHIELIQMMENAGRCLTIIAREIFLDENPKGKKVAVLAGTGGNGGGALVCARRLANWGSQVEVYMTAGEEMMRPTPGHQRKILQQMGVPIFSGEDLPEQSNYDLLIDGIIGYSLKGDPRGLSKDMIQWVNARNNPVLSLDTPSGLDLTSGKIHSPTVHADATLTLAMPKKGLFVEEAKRVTGNLYLGDISVPPLLYAEPSLGLEIVHPFQASDVVRIY